MKRKILIPAVALLLFSSTTFQSCIGNFTLTNKVLTWNKNVNNKFVNELIFFVFWVLPVYEVTAVADLLVINSIEFWSGNKPLEASNTTISTDYGDYQIYADSKGYKITSPDGGIMNFEYDEKTQTWSFAVDDKEKIDFLRYTDAEHIQLPDANGDFVDVELSEEGKLNYTSLLLQPLMANL